MATNKLESKGIEKRKELTSKTHYQRSINEYSAFHDDARSTGDPQGKGVDFEGMGFLLPNTAITADTTTMGMTFSTEQGGGKYDIEGTEGVEGAYQGKAGRDYLMTINIYDREHEYGLSSVDTSLNVIDGQYVTPSTI